MISNKKQLIDTETKHFNLWKKKLKKNNCKLLNYKKVGQILRIKENQFITALYDTTIKRTNCDEITRYITIVKPSVIIVPLLYLDHQVYTMLVSQTRVYDGSEIHEFPAGSIDFGQKPVDAAINELREELHLNFKRKDLKRPYNKPIMIEPSCTSNVSYFFYFKMNIKKQFLKKFHLKKTGDKLHGEKIKIKIKKINQIHNFNSASIHVGLNLVKKYI